MYQAGGLLLKTVPIPFIYTAWVEAGSPLIQYAGMADPDDKSVACLKQNFPNPVSDFIIFEYTLQDNANISLEIKDLTGRTVEILDSGQRSAGTQTIRWEAGELIAGVYFIVLTSDRNIEVQKFLKY